MMAASGGLSFNCVRLIDSRTGQILDQPNPTQSDTIQSVAFSPDGKTVASAGMDHTIQFWPVTRQPRAGLRPLGPPVTGHTDWVHSVAFSPDGRLLASGGGDHAVRLWDVASRQPLGAPHREPTTFR